MEITKALVFHRVGAAGFTIGLDELAAWSVGGLSIVNQFPFPETFPLALRSEVVLIHALAFNRELLTQQKWKGCVETKWKVCSGTRQTARESGPLRFWSPPQKLKGLPPVVDGVHDNNEHSRQIVRRAAIHA